MKEPRPVRELALEHEHHNLANDFYRIEEFEKAIEHYSKALKIRPNLLESYFNRGLAYTRKQGYPNAIADFEKVVSLDPNIAEAHYTLGLVLEHLRRYDDAIENYNKALEIDPTYSDAFNQRKAAISKRSSL